MLIIGSTALNKFWKIRKVNDIDIICYKKQIPLLQTLFNAKTLVRDEKHWVSYRCEDGRLLECLLADDSKSLQIILDNLNAKGNKLKYCSPIYLYVIKAGHIKYPTTTKKWLKHIDDYIYLKQNYYEYLPSVLKQRINLLIKKQEMFMKEVKGDIKTPKLNKVNKSDFFNDKVVKFFEHDDIHKIMAHSKKPTYTKMQKDNTVTCHKDLWDKMLIEDKLNCVLEEAYVIALERKIIPGIFSNYSVETERNAFNWALMRICTNLCSGWFREFAINNATDILKLAKMNYVEKFFNAYQNKEIKLDEKYKENVSRVFNC